MEMKAENQRLSAEDRTLRDLTPNMAALLCYAGGWISGIIFLILEQKSHFVRFHALQSIIVFGTLTLAGTVLGSIPVIGIGFHWIIFTIGFILWIILMVKGYAGEYFIMPWAGNLAERFAAESTIQPSPQPVKTENSGGYTTTQALPPQLVSPTRGDEFKTRYYSAGAKAGRIMASAFAIAWSVVLLIFFGFYNQYIAYYQPVHSDNVTYWQMFTLATSEFYSWLPILMTTLLLSIAGHTILIIFDKYVLRQTLRIILAIFGIATIVELLIIFPFNFNVVPNADAAFWAPIGLTITLLVIATGMGVGTLVRFIQLVVHVAEGKY